MYRLFETFCSAHPINETIKNLKFALVGTEIYMAIQTDRRTGRQAGKAKFTQLVVLIRNI